MNFPIKTPLFVQCCNDFIISGTGDNDAWKRTEWVDLQKLDKGGENYLSQFKILYSLKGIYILFHGEDRMISSDFVNDFDELFKGDVFEIFFHPNPAEPFYFEYEISPLGKELVLLMGKRNAQITAWKPWRYEEGSRVLRKINIYGAVMKARASLKYWTAEAFIPYKLLSVFQNMPPVKGIVWMPNFCILL